MRENGRIITWKASVYTYGTMEGSTKASTRTTKSMDLESILGLMEGAMKDTGTKENNMALVHTWFLRKTK